MTRWSSTSGDPVPRPCGDPDRRVGPGLVGGGGSTTPSATACPHGLLPPGDLVLPTRVPGIERHSPVPAAGSSDGVFTEAQAPPEARGGSACHCGELRYPSPARPRPHSGRATPNAWRQWPQLGAITPERPADRAGGRGRRLHMAKVHAHRHGQPVPPERRPTWRGRCLLHRGARPAGRSYRGMRWPVRAAPRRPGPRRLQDRPAASVGVRCPVAGWWGGARWRASARAAAASTASPGRRRRGQANEIIIAMQPRGVAPSD